MDRRAFIYTHISGVTVVFVLATRHDIVFCTPDLSMFYNVMPHDSVSEIGECHVHHKVPWTVSSCALLGMSSMSTI